MGLLSTDYFEIKAKCQQNFQICSQIELLFGYVHMGHTATRQTIHFLYKKATAANRGTEKTQMFFSKASVAFWKGCKKEQGTKLDRISDCGWDMLRLGESWSQNWYFQVDYVKQITISFSFCLCVPKYHYLREHPYIYMYKVQIGVCLYFICMCDYSFNALLNAVKECFMTGVCLFVCLLAFGALYFFPLLFYPFLRRK